MEVMKHKKTFVITVFIAVFGILTFDNYYDAYKADQTIANQIEQALNSNCDCETISKDMYSKGIQYSKKEGFSVEKVSFSLTNCRFTSLKDEANRIHGILSNEVVGFDTFSLITLDVISEDRHDTVSIRNGKLEI